VELNLIWNEKIFLMERAQKLNPFASEWFAWVDAGICCYRSQPPPVRPFPDPAKLVRLPKDKLVFTASQRGSFRPERLAIPNYHYMAGTAYLLHGCMIEGMANLFRSGMEKVVQRDRVYTDQTLWTYLLRDHPEMFQCIGYDYGEVVPLLY
jgi:hypothetical protein